MKQNPSLALRAVLAVLLETGFYALSIGLAALLAAVPVLELLVAERLHLKLALFCLVGAGTIVWSIFPRRDRFSAPGPEISREEAPGLHALVDELAAATGQPAPERIYLVPDANAWVARRGGFMGIGARPLMGIGLPFVAGLGAGELRAVLAHEFGHFVGGDVRLGPRIWRTRSAIERSVESLGKRSGLLQAPFLAYGRLYLRITQAVSRAQEFAADALSARLAGPAAAAGALRSTTRISAAHELYWGNELGPVLSRGFAPPLAEGFRRYLEAPAIAPALAAAEARELESDATGAYDSHPSTRARLDAIAALGLPAPAGGEDGPAASLVPGLPALEAALLARLAGEGRKFEPLAWESTGEAVWLAYWREWAKELPAPPAGTPLAEAARLAADAALFPAEAEPTREGETPAEAARSRKVSSLGFNLALALRAAGWTAATGPGEQLRLVSGDKAFDPFEAAAALASGELGDEAWRGRCAALGFAEVPFTAA